MAEIITTDSVCGKPVRIVRTDHGALVIECCLSDAMDGARWEELYRHHPFGDPRYDMSPANLLGRLALNLAMVEVT